MWEIAVPEGKKMNGDVVKSSNQWLSINGLMSLSASCSIVLGRERERYHGLSILNAKSFSI